MMQIPVKGRLAYPCVAVGHVDNGMEPPLPPSIIEDVNVVPLYAQDDQAVLASAENGPQRAACERGQLTKE